MGACRPYGTRQDSGATFTGTNVPGYVLSSLWDWITASLVYTPTGYGFPVCGSRSSRPEKKRSNRPCSSDISPVYQ